ncbi:MAG: cadherin-like beta sandwich domain-containing protein [Myxococcota bacterium]|nr:cadherin-like beta sandwich domain-containing protein [Myxococcota bacterium]
MLMMVGACFSGEIPKGRPCSESGECPSGQRCVANVCGDGDLSLLLESLVIRTGSQSQAVTLAEDTFTYDVGVPLKVASVVIAATAKSPADVTLTIDAVTITSGVDSMPATLFLGDNTLTITVRAKDGGASQEYKINISRGAGLQQQAYLKAGDVDVEDQFGTVSEIHMDTLVVGAPLDDGASDAVTNCGAVYVYLRTGTTWALQQTIYAPNQDAGDNFGAAVALEDDTLVVGAPLEDSNASGVGGDGTNNGLDESGAAYVFVRTGTTWSLQAYLKASNTGSGDLFGTSVAIDNNRLLIGAPNEDSASTNELDNSASNAGAVYFYSRTGTTWTFGSYIKAPNPGAFDEFGAAVAVDSDSLAVGATGEDGAGTGTSGNQNDNSAANAGAVYAFIRSGTSWNLQNYIKASNTDAGDLFGISVDIDADTLVVGADHERSIGAQTDNSEAEVGAVYVFSRAGGQWTQQQYLKPRFPQRQANFGFKVAVEADTLVVGSYSEDSSADGVGGDEQSLASENSGAVFVFVRRGLAWTQEVYIKASQPDASDLFGFSVGLSKDTVIVGASREDSAGMSAAQTNTAMNSGAVYVFQ